MIEKEKDINLFDFDYTTSNNISIVKPSSIIQIDRSALKLAQDKILNAFIYVVQNKLYERIEDVDVPYSKKLIDFNNILKSGGGAGIKYAVRLSDIRRYSNTYVTRPKSEFKKLLRDMFIYKESKTGMTSIVSVQLNILEKDKSIIDAYGFEVYSPIFDPFITEGIGSAPFKQSDDYIFFSFGSVITSLLENQGGNHPYSLLKLKIRNNLQSRYAGVLYELLFDYKNLGSIEIEYEKLVRVLGIASRTLREYKHFKQKILTSSVDEINQMTDLLIDWKIGKRNGKKIVSIVFNIKKNIDNTIIYQDTKHTIYKRDFIEYLATKYATKNKKAYKEKIGHEIDNTNFTGLSNELEAYLEELATKKQNVKTDKLEKLKADFLNHIKKIKHEYYEIEQLFIRGHDGNFLRLHDQPQELLHKIFEDPKNATNIYSYRERYIVNEEEKKIYQDVIFPALFQYNNELNAWQIHYGSEKRKVYEKPLNSIGLASIREALFAYDKGYDIFFYDSDNQKTYLVYINIEQAECELTDISDIGTNKKITILDILLKTGLHIKPLNSDIFVYLNKNNLNDYIDELKNIVISGRVANIKIDDSLLQKYIKENIRDYKNEAFLYDSFSEFMKIMSVNG